MLFYPCTQALVDRVVELTSEVHGAEEKVALALGCRAFWWSCQSPDNPCTLSDKATGTDPPPATVDKACGTEGMSCFGFWACHSLGKVMNYANYTSLTCVCSSRLSDSIAFRVQGEFVIVPSIHRNLHEVFSLSGSYPPIFSARQETQRCTCLLSALFQNIQFLCLTCLYFS